MASEILKEVIGVYWKILLEAFNSSLLEERFFVDCKKQRLVLVRKGNKPLEDASSYRLICEVEHLMIDDYLSDRWVTCQGDKWSVKEEVVCGAPQGSRVRPRVWNVLYDDFLRMVLPAGTSIIGFADDTLVVWAADEVRILELKINESLLREKRWLDSRCLKMAPEKTEALLLTDRRT